MQLNIKLILMDPIVSLEWGLFSCCSKYPLNGTGRPLLISRFVKTSGDLNLAKQVGLQKIKLKPNYKTLMPQESFTRSQ